MTNERGAVSTILLIVIVVGIAIVAAVAATLVQQLVFGKTNTIVTGAVIGAVVGGTYVTLKKKNEAS
jgi:hypothetical protein